MGAREAPCSGVATGATGRVGVGEGILGSGVGEPNIDGESPAPPNPSSCSLGDVDALLLVSWDHNQSRPTSKMTSLAVRTCRVIGSRMRYALTPSAWPMNTTDVILSSNLPMVFSSLMYSRQPNVQRYLTANVLPCKASYEVFPSSLLVDDRLSRWTTVITASPPRTPLTCPLFEQDVCGYHHRLVSVLQHAILLRRVQCIVVVLDHLIRAVGGELCGGELTTVVTLLCGRLYVLDDVCGYSLYCKKDGPHKS
jgi:hypothetical protein